MDIMMDMFEEWNAELSTVLESYQDEDDTQDMSLMDFVYEAGDENEKDDAKAKMDNAKNGASVELQGKSVGLLQKMANFIRGIINKAKDAIKNAIEWLKAPGDEKASYEEFLKRAREDPELRDKKITFTDYRKIIADYDNTCTQYEAEYKKYVESQAEEYPSIFKTAKEKLDAIGVNAVHIAESAAASIKVEQMIIMAQSSRKHAEETARKLNLNLLELKALEYELGKPEVQKLQRKLKMLQSRFTIVRLLAGGRNDQSMNEMKAAEQVKNSLWRIFKVEQRMERSRHGESAKNARGHLMKHAVKFWREKRKGDNYGEDVVKSKKEEIAKQKVDEKQQRQYEKRQQRRANKLDKNAQENAKAVKDAEDYGNNYDQTSEDTRKPSAWEKREYKREEQRKKAENKKREKAKKNSADVNAKSNSKDVGDGGSGKAGY